MKRITIAELDRRLTKLENEVAQLKRDFALRERRPLSGWRSIVGTIPDDAMTRRARRYGREYRESDRPKTATDELTRQEGRKASKKTPVRRAAK
jgi:hypothetical protein